MGCQCQHGLGQGSAPRTIPYHLSVSEIDAFLDRHAGDLELAAYLDPTYGPLAQPWGMIVREAAAEFLVWRDPSNVLHVIDVTGEPIVEEVERAPYEPPGSNLFQNLEQRFNALFAGSIDWLYAATALLTAVAVYRLVSDAR